MIQLTAMNPKNLPMKKKYQVKNFFEWLLIQKERYEKEGHNVKIIEKDCGGIIKAALYLMGKNDKE